MHKVGDLLFRSGVGFGFIHRIYKYKKPYYDIMWMMEEYGMVIRGGFQEYEIEDMKMELQREADKSP
jgi:hypothetical protein